MEKLLQNADLYMSTALWKGTTYAVLEAMSMRLPLLLTNCTGNKDLLKMASTDFCLITLQNAIDFINQTLLTGNFYVHMAWHL